MLRQTDSLSARQVHDSHRQTDMRHLLRPEVLRHVAEATTLKEVLEAAAVDSITGHRIGDTYPLRSATFCTRAGGQKRLSNSRA